MLPQWPLHQEPICTPMWAGRDVGPLDGTAAAPVLLAEKEAPQMSEQVPQIVSAASL